VGCYSCVDFSTILTFMFSKAEPNGNANGSLYACETVKCTKTQMVSPPMHCDTSLYDNWTSPHHHLLDTMLTPPPSSAVGVVPLPPPHPIAALDLGDGAHYRCSWVSGRSTLLD
jgi:hypothetical protein